MQVHTSVTKRFAAVAAAVATCAAAGLVAVPAQAATTPATELSARLAPSKIGPVSGLSASAAKPGDAYVVTARWNSLSGAAAYDVKMTHAGTVLSKARVTQPSWTTSTTLTAGKKIEVVVTPLVAKKRGGYGRGVDAKTPLVLPDLTAPVGTYELRVEGTTATITEIALSDDVTAPDRIERFIDWGKGDGFVAWPAGKTASYDYEGTGLWKPKVRLVDEAKNERVIPLKTVVIGDELAPEGRFTTTPRAWANYTRVVLTQLELTDNLSAAADIVRVVDWQDGTTTRWTTGTTVRHVYPAAGTYTPVVRLVDEAENAVDVQSSPVTVAVDAFAPKVGVTVPKRRAALVASWKTLRGFARDGIGTGVRRVEVQVVQKRGTSWYAYRAPSKTWVRAGSTRGAAIRKTRAASATLKSGTWTTQVARLRKGTIVVRAKAVDRVGNVSKAVSVKKSLTR